VLYQTKVIGDILSMDQKLIIGQWVEMREEATPGRLVFRSAHADLPPARGRRRLDLEQSGASRAGRPGSDDRTRFDDTTRWHLDRDRLQIDAGEWQGTYRIKEADGDKLVLEPAD
jgi:hypothetical protein